MGSREKILDNISKAIGKPSPLPEMRGAGTSGDLVAGFASVLEKIGGKAVEVADWSSVHQYVLQHFNHAKRIISTEEKLPWYVPQFSKAPHSFEDVDLAILSGHFGVAENGAVWITDKLMGDRAVPFISQYLALVINKNDIVFSMAEAYDRINEQYDYGTFIAGPSKTADIEQSLVLGAHGPKSMTVFLITGNE